MLVVGEGKDLLELIGDQQDMYRARLVGRRLGLGQGRDGVAQGISALGEFEPVLGNEL